MWAEPLIQLDYLTVLHYISLREGYHYKNMPSAGQTPRRTVSLIDVQLCVGCGETL